MPKNLYLCKCPHKTDDNKQAKKRKRKSTKKFIQQSRNPGYHYGHRDCTIEDKPVPGHMGWLWTAVDSEMTEKVTKGWRPGAIDKNMMRNMKLSQSEIIRQSTLQHLQNVNTIRKSFCKINVDPDAFKTNKTPLNVDCHDEKVQIVVNPPKNPNIKNSKNNVDKNEPMVLNITKKLQQKPIQINKTPQNYASPITHIVQKQKSPKTKPPPAEFEELWNIEYIPPTSWIKSNMVKNSATTGTQCSLKPCFKTAVPNVKVQKSFENTLRSGYKNESKDNIARPKFINNRSSSTINSRSRPGSQIPSKISLSRISS